VDALRKIRVLGAADVAQPEDLELALRQANRILDRWNADHGMAVAVQMLTYTLTPSLSPHTLGPTGAWELAQRPVSIEAAGWVDAGRTTPITVRTDPGWWESQPLKALAQDFPSDVFVNPAWPNAELFFWPIPQTAYDVQLWVKTTLAALTLGATVNLPQGYEDALVKTTAEELVADFNVDMPPLLPQQAREARAVIVANNSPTLPLETADWGMGVGRGFFDYRTGTYRP
jgi:hypothetical protein